MKAYATSLQTSWNLKKMQHYCNIVTSSYPASFLLFWSRYLSLLSEFPPPFLVPFEFICMYNVYSNSHIYIQKGTQRGGDGGNSFIYIKHDVFWSFAKIQPRVLSFIVTCHYLSTTILQAKKKNEEKNIYKT